MSARCGAPWLAGAVAVVLTSGLAGADESAPTAASTGAAAAPAFHGTEKRARVYLTDGSVLAGHVQIEPAVGVHVQLEDGGVVFVSRRDTMRIEEFEDSPPPASGLALSRDESTYRESAEPIFASLDTPRSALLEQEPAVRGDPWVPVCIAPCSARLSPWLAYRVSHPAFGRTDPFLLSPAWDRPVRLTVHTSSPSERVFGLVGLGVGGAAVVAGFFTLYDPACLMGGECGHGGTSFALLGAGAALLITSVLLVRAKPDTSVTMEPAAMGPAAATSAGRPLARGHGAMCSR